MSNPAVFLSYASQDAEAAKRICDALRAAGVEVWFDVEGGLETGDEWDAKIRRQIKECVLFLPVISANTQAREEGYFRIEWDLACERARGIAAGVPFILPIVIDDTREPAALVPDRFRSVQWTRAREGKLQPEAVTKLAALWSHRVGVVTAREKPPAPASPPSGLPRERMLTAQPAKRSVFRFAIALFAAALLASGGWWWSTWRNTTPPATGATKTDHLTSAEPSAVGATTNEKSLVVLPLENLSPDPENAFFTDGMHAEIITTLGRIPELRVISRNSALAFKGGPIAIDEVARKLGVANVVTGSIRREKSRVKIQLELRRASDEVVLWSRTYERDLSDQFATQSEIANDVALALQLRNTLGSMRWARLFTNNPQAYDLFLKTVERYNAPFGSGAKGLARAEECIKGFGEVLRLDPRFSVATSYLARAYINAVGRTGDPEKVARYTAEAKRLAEEFSQAVPGGAGDGALALYYANREGDFKRSLNYAQNVVRALPNDATGYNYLAIALNGLGRSREAVDVLRRALEIDPLTVTYLESYIWTLSVLRENEEMEKAIRKYVSLTGAEAAAVRVLVARFVAKAEVPEDVSAVYESTRFNMFLTARRFAEALNWIDSRLAETASDDLLRAALLAWRCVFLEASKDPSDQINRTKTELGELWKKVVQESRPEPLDRIFAAHVLSALGRGDEAAAMTKAALDALGTGLGVYRRWAAESDAAMIYARVGRKKEAIDLLRSLLREPSGVTVPLLRASPIWDNLRSDPAFQVLIADPKNSAPL